MRFLTHRALSLAARIDPASMTFITSLCDAHWLHRCFGGC